MNVKKAIDEVIGQAGSDDPGIKRITFKVTITLTGDNVVVDDVNSLAAAIKDSINTNQGEFEFWLADNETVQGADVEVVADTPSPRRNLPRARPGQTLRAQQIRDVSI